MAISYDRLWKLLIDNKMNKTKLRIASGISNGTMAKLGKNEQISMETMLKICMVLNCDLGEIVEVTNEYRDRKEL